MTRPTIAICTGLEQASWGMWNQEAALLPNAYITAIQAAGGLALMVPPDPRLVEFPDELLDLVDALILAGGADIDPVNYGQSPAPETNRTDVRRDLPELALARRALALDMPFLGICRGMQVLNVACGGTLHQHLPRVVQHEDHRRRPGTFDGSDHPVKLAAGSLAAGAAGETEHRTLSHHHQGIDALGEGLSITGRAPFDDLPEAIEIPGNRYALGVQWHPEADPGSAIIASLVEAARAFRAARDGVLA